MATYREIGGARIGWFNASFPFAWLRLEDGALTISVLGYRYVFHPEDVVRIEPAGFFSGGVRIVHTRPDVPAQLVFWRMSFSAEALMARLRAAGFGGSAVATVASTDASIDRRFPFRIPALVGAVVLWNALLLADVLNMTGTRAPHRMGPGTQLASALLAIGSLTLILWPRTRPLFLRPGVNFGRVALQVGFVGLIATGMLVFELLSR